jgi:predicted MPP superfamily phosphohydrolase
VPSGIRNALGGVPPEAFTLFLYHTPDLILEAAGTGRVDLYCAGHTHGGQVALPVYGALVTLSKFGKKYESGLHREGQTSLYVTRGVGMEGGSAPRVRFFARPEITVIELAPPPP